MTIARIPVMRPVPPPADGVVARLGQMRESGWFANFGPLSRELEARLASRLGTTADRVVLASSATTALTGALAVADADAWTLPSWTFTATAAAVLAAGGRPDFADVSADDWWLRRSPERGHGTLRVAPFGAGFGPEAWTGRGEVVVDAAASLGDDALELTDLPETASVVFSLHATKVLGAGEGGVAVFGDAERARRFRAWTNFGFEYTRESLRPGVNGKLPEVSAAVALAAFDAWPSERSEWEAARCAADGISDRLGLVGAPGQRGRVSPYWVVRLPDRPTRDTVVSTLDARGIDTRRWWRDGCHRMPAYRDVPHSGLGVTEDLADTVVGLPFSRTFAGRDAERVEAALVEARDAASAW